MEKLFVNFTNHPSEKWSKEQVEAASEYGRIIDVPFPVVLPTLDEECVRVLAEECAATILSLKPNAVLCQGEFTLCYDVIGLLKAEGITVLAATSRREVVEDGNIRTSAFIFERFREY